MAESHLYSLAVNRFADRDMLNTYAPFRPWHWAFRVRTYA